MFASKVSKNPNKTFSKTLRDFTSTSSDFFFADTLYFMPDVLLIVMLTSLSHFIWDRWTGRTHITGSDSDLLHQLQQQRSYQQFLSSSPSSEYQLLRGNNTEAQQPQQQPFDQQPVSTTNDTFEQLADVTSNEPQPPTRNLCPLISHEVLPTFEGENRFNRAARQSRSLTFHATVHNGNSNDRNSTRLFDSILESKRRYRVILKHFRQLQSHSQLLLEVLKNNAANNLSDNNSNFNTNTLVDQSLIKEIENEISTSNAELADTNENDEPEELNDQNSEVAQSSPQNNGNTQKSLAVQMGEKVKKTFASSLHPPQSNKDNLNFAHTSKSAPQAVKRAGSPKQPTNDDEIDDSLAPARMAVSASCATQTDVHDAEEIYRSLLAQAKNIDNVKTHHPAQQTAVANENVADAGVLFSHNASELLSKNNQLVVSDVVGGGGGNESTSSWDKLLHTAPPTTVVSDNDAVSRVQTKH